MKSKLLLLIALFLSAGLLFKMQTGIFPRSLAFADSVKSDQMNKVRDTILNNDRKVLEKNLSTQILSDKYWSVINDFSVSPNQLVNSNNSRALFKLTNGTIGDLVGCLKKNFCGMERRSDNDAYFDENKTPAHILLGRNLEIMLVTLAAHSEYQSEIDWEVIRELTENSNEKVQVMAIRLLQMKNNSGDNLQILNIVDNYKGIAKAQALSEIANSKGNDQDERQLLLNSIEKSFAADDPHTVISIVENLGNMHLKRDELDRVSKYLCHYKENGTDDPNWKMIKYLMHKWEVDLQNSCN
jgi:hypothetical protein